MLNFSMFSLLARGKSQTTMEVSYADHSGHNGKDIEGLLKIPTLPPLTVIWVTFLECERESATEVKVLHYLRTLLFQLCPEFMSCVLIISNFIMGFCELFLQGNAAGQLRLSKISLYCICSKSGN